jgi:hypothetical protein
VEITYDDVTTRRDATGRELRELYELRRSAIARDDTPPTISGGVRTPPRH